MKNFYFSKKIKCKELFIFLFLVISWFVPLYLIWGEASKEDKDIHKVIRTRRSIRRFKQIEIDLNILKQIVEDGSLAATASNKQPWEFIIVNDRSKRQQVFENIYWLAEAGKPNESQKPTAYIIVLGNPQISNCYIYDCSAAAQNILLSAWGYGIGSCWIGSMNKEKLYKLFKIPKNLDIVAVIALGYPDETPSLERVKKSLKKNPTPYKKNNTLIVPKYGVEEILHINEYNK